MSESKSESKSKSKDSMQIFESMPIPRAVFKIAIPAMIAVLFTMIYNLADTFFIGLTHDDMQVAAVSLCTPLFMIFTSVGTVFGMGGASVIARAMGEGRTEYSRKVCSFCMWTGLACGIVLLIVYFILMDPLLSMLGADKGTTWDYAKNYLQMISIAGPFAVIPSAFANIIRCEGKPMIASIGMIGGNILNIILDPVFIIFLGMGTRGAGLATMISMIAATIFYVMYYVAGKPMLTISIKEFSAKDKIASGVISIGIPACLGTVMITVSTIIMQAQMASYDANALAGIGIALRVMMVATLIAGGIGQGVQSMLGYCLGARKFERFRKTLFFSLGFACILCLVLALICYLFTNPIVRLFLTEPESCAYAVIFSRIMLWTSPFIGMFYVMQNTTLAMGTPVRALILNISRQGFVLIPFLFIMKAVMGMNGIAWAQPIADLISFVLAIVLLLGAYRSLKKKAEEPAQEASGQTA